MAKKKKKKKVGKPAFKPEQYEIWLDELRPHLVLGCTLRRAIELSGLMKHKNVLYGYYRDNEEFRDKIDGFRATPGEKVNEALATLVVDITDKIKRKEVISSDDIKILHQFSEKHRTSQPFFVSRTETAEADPDQFGKVVDTPKIEYLVPKPVKKKKAKKDEKNKKPADNPKPED